MWDGINENVDPTIAAVATLMIVITFIRLCAFYNLVKSLL
ncbi:ABC transporter permease [Bordetella pertussis]|nr:ABC transporter permease [Bordetella pertussis]